MNSSANESGREGVRSRGHRVACCRASADRGPAWRLPAAAVAVAVAMLLILGTGAAQPVQAQVGSVLHNFTGSDGYKPLPGVISDSHGNLFGTAQEGGTSTNCGAVGCGTVFEMVYDSSTHSYAQKVLYDFSGSDGAVPKGVMMDSNGNLFGTTSYGGSAFTPGSVYSGHGTVFELSPPATSGGSWTETVLYSFTGATSDGSWAAPGLVMDTAGNLYGTTQFGGSLNDGTVFELSPPASSGGNWTETVLYSFGTTSNDGQKPYMGLAWGPSHRVLYGTTDAGGLDGYGTVFELSLPATSGGNWTEMVIYNFSGTGDGENPDASLILDSQGNLYGTTAGGGSHGYGTAFELSPPASSGGNWTETVLHSFQGYNSATPAASDGSASKAALAWDPSGNLYGTTSGGGTHGYGTVFELTPPVSSGGNWTETVLLSFDGSNGGYAWTTPLMDSAGDLYGVAWSGGTNGDGTVFGIAPVTLSASSLSFGNVAFGSTSVVQTETVTNIGGGQFSYASASLSGADAADFAVTNGCSTAVAPNGTCTVSVAFTPSTATAETATLNLSQGGMTQTVSLSGTGVYPTASLSASSLTFSAQEVGTTSSAQTVTLTNNSVVPLTVSSVGITGDFGMGTNTCTSTVAPSGSCTVSVTFKPTAGGKRTGSLSFNDNASNSPQTVALSGMGKDFDLSPRTLSEMVSQGGYTTFDLLLSPEGGFNQPISLACSGAPKGATCTVNPTSVTLNGINSASFGVKVTTIGNTILGAGPVNFGPPAGGLPLAAWLSLFGLLGLLVLTKLSPKGGRIRQLAPLATLALLITFSVACGGGSSSPSSSSANATPTGTYTLTIKGTSGNLSHSAQVTLKVS